MPSKSSPSERTGAAIINSDDPSTADLRAWAEDKQKHYPGQDGSIAVNNATMNSMVWGGPWILPHKQDTLRPPDERVSHGEARYIGPAGGEGEGLKEADSPNKRKKRHMLSGLFRARGKSVEAGKGMTTPSGNSLGRGFIEYRISKDGLFRILCCHRQRI